MSDTSTSIDDLTNLRLALHRNGYRPVPVSGVHLAMKSAGKRPLMKGWETICAGANETEIRRWGRAQRNCTNTGLLCGTLVGVDIDLLDETHAKQLTDLASEMLGPTLRPDGSILDLPGYDVQTGLLFDSQGDKFPALQFDPSRDTALSALGFLRDLISTFPFVTPADRSEALSAILTTLIRRSLPTAPLHAFNAPTAGTGKSMLVDITSLIATNRPAPVIAQGKSEEEMEKRLGAALIAGDVLIAIDNCDDPLGGKLLCQAMAQTSLKVRILGKSMNAEVPSSAAIFATGNNLTLEGDMTRRAIRATLDAGVSSDLNYGPLSATP